MPEFPLEEVLQLQNDFAEIYRATGLLGISEDYVQVTTKTLAGLADPTTWNIISHTWKDEPVSFHAEVEVQNMRFTAVLHEGQLTEYGLEEPE